MKLNKRKCKVCKTEFQKERPLQMCCSYECAISHVKEQTRIKKAKEWSAKKKEWKDEVTPIGKLKSALQKEINTLIRLIDYGHPCISSGRYESKMEAGHYFTAGGHPEIRFNLMNIYLQSYSDNHHKSGNITGYRLGIKETFGIEIMKEIDGLPLVYQNHKITRLEVIRATEVTRSIIRRHKEAYPNEIMSAKKRIELRRNYQKEIRIC